MMSGKTFLSWIVKEIWEKINLRQVYQHIKALGVKHGKRFFYAAIIWEIIEDVVFPFFSWLLGVPGLIPIFLVLHFEPIVYPAFFWGFRMWDRAHGLEPWEPNRPAQSAYWRSAAKVLTLELVTLGWLSHVIPWKPLAIFAVLVSLFGFVHERIWHDTNFGISSIDTIQPKRVLAKAGTYLLVSSFSLYPLLKVMNVDSLWRTFFIAQGMVVFLFLTLETIWAKSAWGVLPTKDNHGSTVYDS